MVLATMTMKQVNTAACGPKITGPLGSVESYEVNQGERHSVTGWHETTC